MNSEKGGLTFAKLQIVQTFSVAFASPSDEAEILELQGLNHVSVLADDELKNGFVTSFLAGEDIERMSASCGMWVARSQEGKLVGYACANPWNFYGEGPFQSAAQALFPMSFNAASTSAEIITSENSMFYGPVCVAHEFRGQGVLNSLIEAIKTQYRACFHFGVCFIDDRNTRSLVAHESKLGLRRISVLPFREVTYHALAFKCA